MANTIDRIKVAEEERLISPHASNVPIQDVGTWKPKNTQSAIEQLHTDLGNKQSTLVAGETIKFINGKSLLGEGNIEIKEEHLIEKTYTPSEFSGLGRRYLDKNIVGDKNVLTQSMMSEANTIYVIQYDYDLNGASITVPSGVELEFAGGKLSNGTLIGNDTTIVGDPNLVGITGGGYFTNPKINVKWFGAKGDGVTDDTNAIKSAIQFIINISYKGQHNGISNVNLILNSLYFPAGRYIITENNIFASFTPTPAVPKFRLTTVGDGSEKSVLLLKTDSANTLWFYNTSGIGNYNKTGHFYFENLTLTTDDIDYGNGFLQYSTGQEKQLRFKNCVVNVGIFIDNQGTGNADLTVVDKCGISCKNCLILENPQSVTNRFINCAIGSSDDVVIFGNGHAVFTMCEIEVFYKSGEYTSTKQQIDALEESKDGKTAEEIAAIDTQIAQIKYDAGWTYDGMNTNRKNVVLSHGGAFVSQINFDSCRFELHGSVGLFHSDDISSLGTVVLNGCNFGYLDTYTDFISAGFGRYITLNDCLLQSAPSIKFLGNTNTGRATSQVKFLNSLIYDAVTVSGRGGYLLVDGCSGIGGASNVASNNINMQYNGSNKNIQIKEFTVSFPIYALYLIKIGSNRVASIYLAESQKAVGYVFSAKYDTGAGMPNDPQTFVIEASTDGNTYDVIDTIEAGPAKDINIVKEGTITKVGYTIFRLTRQAQYTGAKPGCDISCAIKYI